MAIPNENLYNVTKYYIENVLSLTHEESDFSCKQDDESIGPVIDTWNEAKLGAQPSIETIMAEESNWQTAKTTKQAADVTEDDKVKTFLSSQGLDVEAFKRVLK